MARLPNGQIIKAGRGAEDLGQWLNANLDQIGRAMPAGTRPERLARIFATELTRMPGLIACTRSSLIGGFLQATQCGLEIGSHLGQAWLVPFRVKGTPTATLIIGYKGLVALAYRSGQVANVQAWDVRELDQYEPPSYGTRPEIVHRPVRGREQSEVVAAYAIVRLRDSDTPNMEWMWRDEIDKVRSRSRAAARGDSPWNTDYAMMARKTALRRACKYIPQTTESRALHAAIVIDEEADANQPQSFDFDASAFSPFPSENVVEVVEDDGVLSPEEEERMRRALDASGD